MGQACNHEAKDREKLAAFLETLASRVGGKITNVYHTGLGIVVEMTPDGETGLHVFFSPDDMKGGHWIAGVYIGDDCQDRLSHSSDIPNSCRDANRLATWIEGVKASMV